MPRSKSASTRKWRRSSAIQVEALETRVPVSEGVGPFLTVAALSALGELTRLSALAPPPIFPIFTETLNRSR